MQNAPREHSAILSTFIKLSFVLRPPLSIFEWPLKTGYTVFVLDEVQLSNSGPAIAGSEILFKAVVLDGASHPVYDTTHFEYNWFNTVDGYKVCNYMYVSCNIDVMMKYVICKP